MQTKIIICTRMSHEEQPRETTQPPVACGTLCDISVFSPEQGNSKQPRNTKTDLDSQTLDEAQPVSMAS